MSIQEIQEICNKLPAVTEDIKWGDHLCFNVGGKMFLVTGPDNVPPTASIKVSDTDFEELTAREGIIPAPYLARYKWVFLDDISRFSKNEWQNYIPSAYHLIAAKLPAKEKRKIGLEANATVSNKRATVLKRKK